MHDKLATCLYLQSIGGVVDQVCCLCNKNDEILDHLFFGCDVAKEVWREVTAWCGLQRPTVKWSLEKE